METVLFLNLSCGQYRKEKREKRLDFTKSTCFNELVIQKFIISTVFISILASLHSILWMINTGKIS